MHQQKMQEVDQRYYLALAQRDAANEGKKNKTQRGVVVERQAGCVLEKLRKSMGGKAAQRIVKHERRLGREQPDAIKITAIFRSTTGGEVIREAVLCRGRDYVMLRQRKGEPVLVLDDGVSEFRAEHSADFAESLLA